MAYLNLASIILTPRWTGGSDTAYLYIWASQAFFEATTGEYIAQGTVGDFNSFAQKITCTVSGTTVTIPSVTLATTTDSTVPNTTYTAILYNESNVHPYPLLQQFFVDPDYLQVTPQSSALVAGAGTSAVNGVYSYRGQFGDHPYYNLVGQPTSTSNNCIKFVSPFWRITDGAGANMYSRVTGDFPWSSATSWSVVDGSSPAPTVSEDVSLLASTWENLIISNQGSQPWPQPWNEYWTIPQVKQYVNNQLAAADAAGYASALIAGITQLSDAPDITSQPIALGVNNTDYVNLTNSVSSDGSRTTITEPVDMESTATIDTSLSINHGAPLLSTDATGTGNLVKAVSPTLTTPTLGVAAATSIAIGGGTVISTSNCTGTGNLVKATSPTLATPVLGVAAGTSLALGGGTALTTTNRTGTGNLVLATSPTLTTPVLGVAVATSIAIGGGTALTSSNQTGTGSLVLATSPTLVTPTLGVAACTSLAINGGTVISTSNCTGTGSLVKQGTPTLTTPVIGVATGTSLVVTGLLKSSGTAGIGYATGAGGAQTQATNKSTTVVSNTITTAITMNNASLAAGAAVSFTFTNSTIAATDTITVTHQSAGTSGAYFGNAFPGSGTATITVRNLTAGDLAEAIVLRVTVIKSVSS